MGRIAWQWEADTSQLQITKITWRNDLKFSRKDDGDDYLKFPRNEDGTHNLKLLRKYDGAGYLKFSRKGYGNFCVLSKFLQDRF